MASFVCTHFVSKAARVFTHNYSFLQFSKCCRSRYFCSSGRQSESIFSTFQRHRRRRRRRHRRRRHCRAAAVDGVARVSLVVSPLACATSLALSGRGRRRAPFAACDDASRLHSQSDETSGKLQVARARHKKSLPSVCAQRDAFGCCKRRALGSEFPVARARTQTLEQSRSFCVLQNGAVNVKTRARSSTAAAAVATRRRSRSAAFWSY